MKFATAYRITLCFLGSALVLAGITTAQQQNTAAPRRFAQPAPEKEVTITAIPGVIAANAKWKLVWQVIAQGFARRDSPKKNKGGQLMRAQSLFLWEKPQILRPSPCPLPEGEGGSSLNSNLFARAAIGDGDDSLASGVSYLGVWSYEKSSDRPPPSFNGSRSAPGTPSRWSGPSDCHP